MRTLIQSQYLKALTAVLQVGFCDEWKRGFISVAHCKILLHMVHIVMYTVLLSIAHSAAMFKYVVFIFLYRKGKNSMMLMF